MVAKVRLATSVASDSASSSEIPKRLEAALEYARRRSIELNQKTLRRDAIESNIIDHYAKRHEANFQRFKKNVLYPGLFIICMSLPPAFADQMFELNKIFKSHDISSHELGLIGIAIGISTIANGALNIYFERRLHKELIERLRYIRNNDKKISIRRSN
jgi:hypothetical protein